MKNKIKHIILPGSIFLKHQMLELSSKSTHLFISSSFIYIKLILSNKLFLFLALPFHYRLLSTKLKQRLLILFKIKFIINNTSIYIYFISYIFFSYKNINFDMILTKIKFILNIFKDL